MKKALYHFDIKEIKPYLRLGSNVVITTHKNPDGDAIGSSLALYHYCLSLQLHASVIIPNEEPAFLQWLPGHEKIIHFNEKKEKALALIRQADIIFMLDFNVPDRLGDMETYILQANTFKVLIDHHPEPESFANHIYSDTSVSSTAEKIYQFIHLMSPNFPVSRDLATCLFVGIMTDTGCFSFNSSSPEMYQVVANLLAKGINKDRIYDLVYNNYSESRMKLLGYSLSQKMKVLKEYRTSYIYITKEEQQHYGFQAGDSEGFVNYPLSIRGVRFSALFLEKGKYVKISFRSKGNFPVNKFSSAHFYGGGHVNAAGGESKESLQEVIQKFEALLPGYKTELLKDD